MDGVNKQDFAKAYPNGLVAKWVRLDTLDAVLCNHNLRTAEEVWSVGDKSKAAKVLLDWIECRALTPPLLKPFSLTELCLHGGNHRLAVARANRELEVPVLIEPEDLNSIGQLVTLCDHPNGSVPTH